MINSIPLVSVLITTYNHEKWVSSAIESVLNQTYPNIEILIHDDNSSDNTWSVVNGYTNRFKFACNSKGPNKGVSKSINCLLNECNGEYVAFMSGDDVWHTSKISKQINHLNENTDCNLLFTDSITIDSHGQFNPRFHAFESSNLNYHQWIFRLMLGNCLPATSALIKNNNWLKKNKFSISLRQLQDWDFWIRFLASNQRFQILNEPLLYYRVHHGSISNSIADAKLTRETFETITCLKRFTYFNENDIENALGSILNQNNPLANYKNKFTNLAFAFSLIQKLGYQLAAAELIQYFYEHVNLNMNDNDYHNFIGRLNI